MGFIRVAVFIILSFAANCFASEGAIKVIPDSSVFIQIINFIILVFLLNIFLYRPIRNIIIQRKEKIEKLNNSTDDAIKEAEEDKNIFAEKIKNYRLKGLKKKEELIDEARTYEKMLIEEINRKAETELSEVKRKLSKDVERVRNLLEGEIGIFAKSIGEKLLGRTL